MQIYLDGPWIYETGQFQLAASGAYFFGAGATIPPHTARAQAPAHAIEGNWSGAMGELPDLMWVEVNIHQSADGRYVGSVFGFDKNNSTVSIDLIEQNGAVVRLVVGEVGGGFVGTLSADGTKLTGAWSQLAIATPLVLTKLQADPPIR